MTRLELAQFAAVLVAIALTISWAWAMAELAWRAIE